MASNRHLGRIVAFQTLYEFDFRGEPKLKVEAITERNLEQYERVVEDTDFVHDLVAGVLKNQQKLDEMIAPAAPEWPVEQIARVDKVILRMAVYELAVKAETPPKVVINEAVEIAKSFGGENSSKFVNGVLGTIYRERTEQSAKSPNK